MCYECRINQKPMPYRMAGRERYILPWMAFHLPCFLERARASASAVDGASPECLLKRARIRANILNRPVGRAHVTQESRFFSLYSICFHAFTVTLPSEHIILMAIGAKRNRTPANGLPPGERLRRDKISGVELYSQWRWVSRISDPSLITTENLFAAYGFSDNFGKPICKNRYSRSDAQDCKERKVDVAHEAESKAVAGEDEDDVIIISSGDEEIFVCDKKRCKENPHCLNYLGQVKLENQGLCESNSTLCAILL